MRGFAAHQPVTPIIETLRGLPLGAPDVPDAPLAVARCAGPAVVGPAGSALLFRSRSAP